MNQLESSPPSQDEKITRGLGVSFAFHALIFLFFSLKTVFFRPEVIDFTQAVRVDIVGLPDKVEPATVPPPNPAEAKPALPEKPQPEKPLSIEEKRPAKPDKSINLERVKSKQQNALDKLKAMAALEKIKQEVTSAPKIKGQILSPGSALTGLAKLQHESYAATLDSHIKQSWSLPEWLAQRELKAQARVYIDSRGNILGRKIVKSSGNPNYDDEVLATIDRSAPFPAPPEKFLALVSVDGILIGFPE